MSDGAKNFLLTAGRVVDGALTVAMLDKLATWCNEERGQFTVEYDSNERAWTVSVWLQDESGARDAQCFQLTQRPLSSVLSQALHSIRRG